MTRLATALFAFAFSLSVAPAIAGDFADAAAVAEDLVATDTQQAAEAARIAYADFTGSLPFALVSAFFVTEPAEGYGMYTEHAGSFKPGQPILLYCEPIGLGWKEGGRGFQSAITVDFEITDSAGQVLGGQKKFGSFKFDSAVRNQEIMINLTMNVDGAEAGDYQLIYTFTDENSGETAVLPMPFSIAP
ncbi:hypothetical protein [Hoeflea marina]|nr:hypothetical protein [Hoeflea marina]